MVSSTPGGVNAGPTHEVTNQAVPFDNLDAFAGDPLLAGAVEAGFARLGLRAVEARDQRDHLATYGRAIGAEAARELGRQANEHPPKLASHDRYGRRIDRVEFHPAYHALMTLGLGHGVSSRAWTHPEGGHVAHAALLFMTGWADAGVCCPFSMTYAAVPALDASAWSSQTWRPRVLAGAYDRTDGPAETKAGCTLGMAMTEKQGGSDVRANTTRAEAIAGSDDEVTLVGHKWFCSAPMSDAFLTLAYEDAGLSCFLVPRWTPDGAKNAIEIQRLKDKLGDRSNPSSEIEYRHAWARRVGEPGRGVRTIVEMVRHTRLDCLVGSAALARIAVALAIQHASTRTAFQKTLTDHPAMIGVLADLAIEVEAQVALAFRIAAAFDAGRAGDAREAAFARIAAPIAKYWICKRCPGVVSEAMECLGGAGFVEEHGLARLFRQSPLNAIWEGSGNVIALDVLRALTRQPETFDALTAELDAHADAGRGLAALAAWIKAAPAAGDATEAGARLFVERAAIALTLAALAARGGAAFGDYERVRVLEPSHLYGATAHRIDARAAIDRARVRAD